MPNFLKGLGAAFVDNVWRPVSTTRAPSHKLVYDELAQRPLSRVPVDKAGSFTVTLDGEAFREVNYSGAGGAVATFDFAGMVADQTYGTLRQKGAGVLTVAGATVVYPPHLSTAQGNAPTTIALRGYLDWVYRGGTTIEIVSRSEDDTGGTAGAIELFTFSGTAPTDGNSNVLVNNGSLGSGVITPGSLIEMWLFGAYQAVAGSGNWLVRFNGDNSVNALAFSFASDGVPSTAAYGVVNVLTAATARSSRMGDFVQGAVESLTTSWASATPTVSIFAQRGTGLTRTASFDALVRVSRKP